MARDLAPDVERLLQFRDPNIRKKAALCSIRIVKKVPDLAENFINPAASLLKEKHHGVLLTGIQLCTDLCRVSAEALEYFRKKCTEGLVKVLKDVVNSPYAPEYDISGIADPFLHIRLLRLLRVLGQGDADASDCMNDILAQVATKTESNKNAGNAILYECVETIMSIEDNSGLRVLAINILGRFLSNRDNNIRYVALNMLMKAITVDTQAVQRHRPTILERVKDSDASIRKRALELVYLLVNESNVKPLTKELIEYLEAGNYVKDEVWHALIVVITNASNLHGYTVRSLYRAVQTSGEQVTESDAVDVIEVAIKHHTTDLTTRAMRIKDIIVQDKGNLVLELQQRSIEFNSVIEKHQNIRSALVERMPVLDEATYSGRRAGSLSAAVSTSQGAALNLSNGVAKAAAPPLVDLLDLSSDDTPAPSSSGNDFLQDLLGVDLSPASSQAGQAQKSGTDVLLDLLSIGSPSAQDSSFTPNALSKSSQDDKTSMGALERLSSPSASSIQASSPAGGSPMMDLLDGFASSPPLPEANGLAYPSVVAFESNSLRVMFNFSKQPGNPRTTLIEATFMNKSSVVYTDFIFQAAVPKFLQLHLDPASSNSLPESGNGSITQKLRLTNSQHGKKALVMRIRINYKVNSKDTLEEGQISNFPRDL
ncbi:hypothetical protein RJ639_007745 [Escallonia herrerae]|uniref:AP-1 complex subunit gamma n=1 Tax=Escallonia herrerae TaxID=1293975 RepID=A0AA89AUD1_9ASTE|nr:hypothetical protein RJ639_007745 [Escallonia herrerae]